MNTSTPAYLLPLYHPDNPDDPASYTIADLAHCPDVDDFYDQRQGPECADCAVERSGQGWDVVPGE